MYPFLTELVRLVREQPGIFPVLFGVLMVVVNAPGSPIFLGLDPTLCAMLTDAGFTIAAVGLAGMFFKRFTSTQSTSIAKVQQALEDLSETLIPGSELEDRLNDLDDHVQFLEDKQGRMLDMSSMPYYEADSKGRIYYVNQAYADLYGVSSAQIFSNQPLTWIHPREQARVYQDAHRAIQNRGGYAITARIVKSGRERCKVTFNASPLWDGDENFVGHYGTVKVLEDYRNK